MAVITRASSEVDGAIAEASSVNRSFDDLYTLQNGNINSANIQASGVRDGNLGTSAVVARALDSLAVADSKLDFSAFLLIKEVF